MKENRRAILLLVVLFMFFAVIGPLQDNQLFKKIVSTLANNEAFVNIFSAASFIFIIILCLVLFNKIEDRNKRIREEMAIEELKRKEEKELYDAWVASLPLEQQIEIKRQKEQAWYASLSPEQQRAVDQKRKKEAFDRWYASLPLEQQYVVDQQISQGKMVATIGLGVALNNLHDIVHHDS